MAKAFVILLAFLYAFSATGASVHLHYCCGKLQHVAVQDEENTDHGDCPLCLAHHESKKHAGCDDTGSCETDARSHNHCQDIQVDARKTTGEHLPGSDKNLTKIQSLELLVFTLVHFVPPPSDICDTNPTPANPLLTETTPLFVRYCTYLI